jgi:anti-sigma factor RsiW
MTCREFIEFLIDYFEGALSAAERARFEEHLAECPACLAYLDNYRTAVQLCQQAYRAERDACAAMPDELVRAILAARKK